MIFISTILDYLTIIVDDENDNNPVFKERIYKRSISENSPIGNVIANIAATDKVFHMTENLNSRTAQHSHFCFTG